VLGVELALCSGFDWSALLELLALLDGGDDWAV